LGKGELLTAAAADNTSIAAVNQDLSLVSELRADTSDENDEYSSSDFGFSKCPHASGCVSMWSLN
jgi:hypothetical protein